MVKRQIDLEILKDGSIAKYHNEVILNVTLNWLRANGYRIIEVDVADWNGKNFHARAKATFSFPDYYGDNMNAFYDCMEDVYASGGHRLAIVMKNIDDFARADKALVEAVLDHLSRESRWALVKGKYIIGLLHSKDPDIQFSPVGGICPQWNGEEWFSEPRRNKQILPDVDLSDLELL